MKELDPDKDLSIDVTDLSTEFRMFPTTLFQYYKYKAKVEAQRDMAKATLKETKALCYKRIKSDMSLKLTEKGMEAEIDTDPVVIEANLKFIRAEHDATTWGGAVDSMKSKKDMLMQLGADNRKEK